MGIGKFGITMISRHEKRSPDSSDSGVGDGAFLSLEEINAALDSASSTFHSEARELAKILSGNERVALDRVISKYEERALPLLMHLLTASDSPQLLRYTTHNLLREMRDPRAVPALIEALQGPDHSLGMSIAAQGALRHPNAVPALIEILRHTDDDVRLCAARALLDIPDARAVPELIDALRSTHPGLRFAAVETLGKLGPNAAAAVPELVSLLHDSDFRVRDSSAEALGNIGAITAILPLRAHLARQDDYHSKAIAEGAIRKLERT